MNLQDFWPFRKKEIRPWAREGEADPVAPPRKPRVIWNVGLFILTLMTTVLAGALQEGVNPLKDPGQIPRGIPFALALMGILLAHELGHYLVAKRHGVDVTLPYFIPFPLSPFGTMGAFIQLKEPPKNKRILLDNPSLREPPCPRALPPR